MFAISKELLTSYKDVKKPRNLTIRKIPIKNVNICVIDDSPTIQEGVVAAIKNIPYVESIIKTSQLDYFEIHSTKKIDIIITEIEFGNKIEVSFIEQIKSISPKTKIIVYTRIQNHSLRNRLLRNGADAFIFLRDISYLLEHIVKIMIRTNFKTRETIHS